MADPHTIQDIIDRLENFYHVWIIGARGDVIEVQKKMCDYDVISRQSAKQRLGEPCIGFKGSKDAAEEEMKNLEALGLICRLEHYGPKWLDGYSEDAIVEKFKSFYNGDINGIYIKEYKPGTYAIYCENSEAPMFDPYLEIDEETDEMFGLYLASIRYLALNNRVM